MEGLFDAPVSKKKLQLEKDKPYLLEAKTLVCMRGLPGSGKTWTAEKIREVNSRRGGYSPKAVKIISSADFLTGEYTFESMKDSHVKAKYEADVSLKDQKMKILIIDNTNVKASEMKYYYDLSVKYGYKFVIFEAESAWAQDPVQCAKKTPHNVPLATIRKMSENYNSICVEDVKNSRVI